MNRDRTPTVVDLGRVDLAPIRDRAETLLGALGHLERARANGGFGKVQAILFGSAGIAACELELALESAGFSDDVLSSGPKSKVVAFEAAGQAALEVRAEGSLWKAEINTLPDLRAQRAMLEHAVELLREAVPPKAKKRASTARGGRIDAEQVAEFLTEYINGNPSKPSKTDFCRWRFKGDETKAQSLRRSLKALCARSPALSKGLQAIDGKIKPAGMVPDRRRKMKRGM